VDGGTIRLPRLIGHSRAMDLILTGRGVAGDEAVAMGLVNRLTEPGGALPAAVALGHELAALPQGCLRRDRRSAYEQWDLSWDDATTNETRHGIEVLNSGESLQGAARFSGGAGRVRPLEVAIGPGEAGSVRLEADLRRKRVAGERSSRERVPPERVGTIDVPGRQEDGGGRCVLAQYRLGGCEVVQVPVVERDRDDGASPASGAQRIPNRIETNDVGAVGQARELACKAFRRHTQAPRVDGGCAYAVVHQHQPVRCGTSPRTPPHPDDATPDHPDGMRDHDSLS